MLPASKHNTEKDKELGCWALHGAKKNSCPADRNSCIWKTPHLIKKERFWAQISYHASPCRGTLSGGVGAIGPAYGCRVTQNVAENGASCLCNKSSGETFNPAYVDCVKELLRLDFCIGIIGGKPRHSLYFVGYQDDTLLFLDPHYCQLFVDTTKENFPLESFHCNSPRKTAFSKVDPSCTIGFYVSHRREFEGLCVELTQVLNSAAAKEKYPMFSIVDGCAQDYGLEELCSRFSQQTVQGQRPSKRGRAKKATTEDFVVL